MPHADINRVRKMTAEKGLDALMSLTPDNYYYLSGHQAGFGRVGNAVTIIPADSSLTPAMTCNTFDETWAKSHTHIKDVRSLLMWMEIDELADLEKGTTKIKEKPTQHNQDQLFQMIADILTERKLDKGKIGCELGAAPGSWLEGFKRFLPNVTLVDATGLYWEIRNIKTPEEIAALREAVRLAELGFKAIMLDSNPRGKTVSQLKVEYQIAIMNSVKGDKGVSGFQSCRAFITAGGDISPRSSRDEHAITDGDVIFFDFGATVDGYASDVARPLSVGQPNATVQRIWKAIQAGFETGWPMFKPGTPMKDIFVDVEKAMRANGLPTITRGHYGHTIGSPGEQPPFIAPGEPRSLEPGMCLAFETPYYVRGLGGFNCEDNFVITEKGVDNFSKLPQQMFVI